MTTSLVSPSSRFALLLATLGMVGLGAVIVTIPFLGDEPYGPPTDAQQIKANFLILLPAGALLYGLLALAAHVEVPKLLLAGAATGTLGLAIDYSSIQPTFLEGRPPDLLLFLLFLFLANALRLERLLF